MLSRSDGLTCTAQDSAAALTRQTQDAIIAARAQARSGCRTRPTWSGPSGGTACSLGTRRGCGSRTGALQRTHGPVQRVATQAQPDATRCDGSQRIARGRTTLRGGAARCNQLEGSGAVRARWIRPATSRTRMRLAPLAAARRVARTPRFTPLRRLHPAVCVARRPACTHLLRSSVRVLAQPRLWLCAAPTARTCSWRTRISITSASAPAGTPAPPRPPHACLGTPSTLFR
jgi:hypothetical protein